MATHPPEFSQAPHPARRPLRWVGPSVLIAVLVLLAAAGAWVYWRVHACLPQLDGTIRLQGLQGKVQVFRDAHGVPHIQAASLADAIFAQGYVTAQDRLWQMDLSRRIAQGTLSELFGPRTLNSDIMNRTLGMKQAAERGVRELDADEQELLQNYALGVNAFIRTHQSRLPVEFLLLRYHPESWRESDSLEVALNMARLLNTSWPDELMRERVRSKLGSAALESDIFPASSPLDHPEAGLSPNISPPPAPGSIAPSTPKTLLPRLPEAPRKSPAPLPGDLAGMDPMLQALESSSSYTGVGSNNWVVSGAHTRSGKPLLANDPHLPYGVPSVWYMVHLEAPGLDVSGVSLPGLPMVIIGHNRHIAWGVTNTGPDVQDLYEETFNPLDPREYFYDGKWVRAIERLEKIKVRGRVDKGVLVRSTRYGPVLPSTDTDNRTFSLAWTALLPHALQFPFLKIDEARNWKEFSDALSGFVGPMQNFVYADVKGNIGFYAAGWIPIRKRSDGDVPAPGSGDDYGWLGMVPFQNLPHAYNPKGGILATANGRVVPDDYPYFITSMWGAPYRTARIYQLLDAGKSFTASDMLRVQMDIHPLDDEWLRDRLVDAANEYPPHSADAQFAMEKLRAWNGEATAGSAATLVCELTKTALLHRILAPRLGKDLAGYHGPMSTVFLQNVIDNNLDRWLPTGDQDLDQTLMKSLDEAVRQIPKLVGSNDHAAWKWGSTIPLTFRHPLGGGSWLLGWLLNLGPFPQSGTANTIKRATLGVGPSMRMVVDLGNLEDSVQNITLGESGQVFSPYYKDQIEAWYHGQSFPMLFSDEDVQKGTVHRLVLEPAIAGQTGMRETRQ
ncbi:MAG TPA: penicillin acylase family protein [Terriglobia bacterium]|nr:penicillin acylase family protein [Terriglobia bacterium]